MLGLILILISGGCSSVASGGANVNTGGADPAAGPVLSLLVGGNTLDAGLESKLSGVYRNGITIMELLKGSGVVVFDEEGKHIRSVNRISLSHELEWELRLNGKVTTAAEWNQVVENNAKFSISAHTAGGEEVLQPIILAVNGGNRQTELTHSYVMVHTEDLTVRSLLKKSRFIRMAEDNKTLVSVLDYKPLSNETWMLQVNGKPLLESGMDMKLRPQDELEVNLVTR
ncbi:hypothetical protein J7E73_16145 [Paenibacillus albidus]|nr:hypothetical protein [Paenibacillus albidus]